MRISRINSTDDFRSLKQSWDALVRQCAYASIFQTWDWQYLWWKHYGAGRQLYLLAASDDAALIGLLPLYLAPDPSWPVLRLTLLRPIGTGGDTAPDYLGPIIAAGREAEVCEALLQFLHEHRREWNGVLFSDIPDGAPFLQHLVSWARRDTWLVECGASARISFLCLPKTWEDYLGTLSGDRRYAIRNVRRKLLSQVGARFFVWTDAATLDWAIDRLVELHHARWESKGEKHSFASSVYNQFHREVMKCCLEAGTLRLYCLEIEGSVVAMYYCYAWADTIYYFQGGFDPAYDKLRPGLCLMGFAIENAIEEGCAVFDMLRGEYEYKRQWAKQTRDTRYLLARRVSPRSLLQRALSKVSPLVKNSIKKLLRYA